MRAGQQGVSCTDICPQTNILISIVTVAIYLSDKSFAYVHRNQYIILVFSK